jgi:hypothetical protein
MDFFVSPEWNQQVLDDNGNPAFGWKIYTYIAGSTTPIDTYTDATGNTTNPNPIILPADGRYELWLEQDVAYKIVLTDENDVSRKTVDNVVGGIQGSGGGGLDFVSVAQSDTISLDGLGTVALPLTATVNISSISSQAITITTGGIYARDYGIEISDLETAVANKLDKVQTAGQNVVSSVDFEKGIQLELGYFGTGSPQLFFGTATNAYIHKQPNGDLVVVNQPSSGNNGGLGIRTVPATSKVETDLAAGNNNLTITEGDATTPAVMRFELFDEGGGKEYFFDAVDTNNSPTKIYGRDASNKLVEIDPTFISSVAWGDITGNIANQPDVNLQSVTDNGPATTNAIQTGDITVTTPAAGGESLKLPDFSWIQPLNSNTGLFITNHTSPAPSGGGSIHIDNGVNLYSGNGTVIQSQIGCDPSAGVFLASYDLAGIVAANIQLAPNDIQILSQAGSQIIANASNLTLQGPASQALIFNSSSQAFLLDIPTGTPIQDPVESYYYYEDPIAGELKKTTFGVFKNLVQASDQSQTNFIAMNFTGGAGGTGSLISSDRMDIQSFGVMNILPGNVTPNDGDVLVYRTVTGGLTYEPKGGGSTPDLQAVTTAGATTNVVTEFLTRLLVGGATDNSTDAIQVDGSYFGTNGVKIENPSDAIDAGFYHADGSTNSRYLAMSNAAAGSRIVAGILGTTGTANSLRIFAANTAGTETLSATAFDDRFEVDQNLVVNDRALIGNTTDDLINDLQVDGSVRVGDTTDTSPNFVNIYAGNAQSMGVQYREWNGANSFGFNNYYDGSTNTFNFDAVESNVVTGNVMRLSRSSRRVIIENSIEVPRFDNVPTGTIQDVYGQDASGNFVKGTGGGGSTKKFKTVTYARAGLINGANVAFTTDAAFTNPHFYTSNTGVNWNLKNVTLNSAFGQFSATNFDLVLEYVPVDTAWSIGSGTVLHTESFTGVTKNVANSVIQGAAITVAVPNNVNIFAYFKLNLGIYSMTDAMIVLSLEEQ